jgi:hypothetical protein
MTATPTHISKLVNLTHGQANGILIDSYAMLANASTDAERLTRDVIQDELMARSPEMQDAIDRWCLDLDTDDTQYDIVMRHVGAMDRSGTA